MKGSRKILEKKETGIYKIEVEGKTKYLAKASKVVKVKGVKKKFHREKVAPNLAQARRAREELKVELANLAKHGPATKVNELLDEYYLYLNKRKLAGKRSPDSVISEKSVLDKHVRKTIGDMKVQDVTESDILGILEVQMADLSQGSKIHLRNYVSNLYKFARRQRIASHNPCEYIELKRPKPAPKQVLNEEQINLLLEHTRAEHPEWFYHYFLCIHLLLRAGEARGLMFKDINWNGKNSTLRICRTLSPKTGIKDYTKNGDERTVPLNAEVRKVLRELKKLQNATDEDFILPRNREFMSNEQGKPLKLILKSLKLPLIRFHDLRSSGLTLLLNHSVPLSKVMRIAGHKRLSSTEIYARITGEMVKGATEGIELLNGNSRKEVSDPTEDMLKGATEKIEGLTQSFRNGASSDEEEDCNEVDAPIEEINAHK